MKTETFQNSPGQDAGQSNLLGKAISRRGLLTGMAALAAASKAVPASAASDTAYAVAQAPPYVYIGCYTPAGRGISIYSANPQTNTMILSNIVGPVSNPSWLALDPTKKFLYAVNEVNAGQVMAFSINPATGDLTFLNQQSSGGANPAHMAVHPSGKFVIVANYSGSTVETIPLLPDGSLAAPTQVLRHIGDLGPNTGRQEAPHPHMVLPDSSGKYVLVNDLGMDATFVYALDQSAGKLSLVSTAFATPGSGPRHLAWHPNGRIVYSINEMTATLNVYAWDGSNGTLTAVQSDVSTLPPMFQGPKACAEVLVAPSGNFVYASNRGHNSIATYAVDPINSRLNLLGWTHTQGETPRAFMLDPSGQFLHVAHQNTANIVSFKVDINTGSLTPNGQYLASGSPTCIVFGSQG